jgi:hypothetical protein
MAAPGFGSRECCRKPVARCPADSVPFSPRIKFPTVVPPFLQRLSPRERLLTLLTATALAVLANFAFLNYFVKAHREGRAALTSRQLAWRVAQIDLSEEPMWTNRESWLRAHQPKLGQISPQRAGGELLDRVALLARQSGVLLENPQVNPAETLTPAAGAGFRQPVSVSVLAKSDWKAMVEFLAALQAEPQAFLVPEVATLRSDPADPQRMRAELRIAKWYAPAGS